MTAQEHEELLGFNSLQTGRCVASVVFYKGDSHVRKKVSIPFKREGVLQATPVEVEKSFNSLQTGRCVARNRDLDKFQFPSNGKVCCKCAQV